MPNALKPVLYFFAALAAAGLLLSVASHIAALRGTEGPLGHSAWMLHIGIFVVWLPAVLAARYMSAEFPAKDMWKASLRGCPVWMKYMVGVLFAYALVNFLIAMRSFPGRGEAGATGWMPASVVRGFSGHWMVFYGTAMAVLYSAARVKDR